MPTTVSFNGASYQIPVTGNLNYGAYTSAFMLAVASGAAGKAVANTFSALQTFTLGIALPPQAAPSQTTAAQLYNLTATGDAYLLARTGFSTTPYKLTQAWLQPVAQKTVVAGPTSGADAYATARLLVAGDIPDIAQSQVTGLVAALAAKADDSLVVHLAGIETITGAKTFSAAPTLTLGAAYGAAAALTWSGRSVASSPADGIVLLTNNAATGFTRLQLGGTTSSFPSLKRSTTSIAFRLADDSADAPITASQGSFSTLLAMTAASSTAAAPAISLSNTPSSGLYAAASGTTVGLTVSGTSAAAWTSALATFASPLRFSATSTAAAASIQVGNTAGTGLYGTATTAGLSTSGTSAVFVDGSQNTGIGNVTPSTSTPASPATGVSVLPASTGTGATMMTVSGDISAQGGFRSYPLINWKSAVAINQTNQQMAGASGTSPGVQPYWVAPRTGSITGFSFAYSIISAGTLTITVYKNGVATAAAAAFTSAGSPGTTGTGSAVFAKDAVTYAANDYIDIRYTTSGTFAPVGASTVLTATLEVES